MGKLLRSETAGDKAVNYFEQDTINVNGIDYVLAVKFLDVDCQDYSTGYVSTEIFKVVPKIEYEPVYNNVEKSEVVKAFRNKCLEGKEH